jgi:hypothetical protein
VSLDSPGSSPHFFQSDATLSKSPCLSIRPTDRGMSANDPNDSQRKVSAANAVSAGRPARAENAARMPEMQRFRLAVPPLADRGNDLIAAPAEVSTLNIER